MAKKKGAKKKAAKKKAAAMGRSGGVDLAEVLRREGVDEQRIPDVLAMIRSLSDAQADENSAPSAPTQTLIDSPAGLIVAASANAVVEERERLRARTRQAIQSGRASGIQGRRDSLWTLEPPVLQMKTPRISFVGRAIHANTNPVALIANYVTIFETINRARAALLPETVRQALRIIHYGPGEGSKAEKRKRDTSARSTLRKTLDGRIDWLVNRLSYAETMPGNRGEVYRLNRLGRQVFENWPDWNDPDANPWVEEEPPAGVADTPTDIT
jgi:hypothetical protein